MKRFNSVEIVLQLFEFIAPIRMHPCRVNSTLLDESHMISVTVLGMMYLQNETTKYDK